MRKKGNQFTELCFHAGRWVLLQIKERSRQYQTGCGSMSCVSYSLFVTCHIFNYLQYQTRIGISQLLSFTKVIQNFHRHIFRRKKKLCINHIVFKKKKSCAYYSGLILTQVLRNRMSVHVWGYLLVGAHVIN